MNMLAKVVKKDAAGDFAVFRFPKSAKANRDI